MDMHSFLLRYGAVDIHGRQRIDIGNFLRYLCKIAYGSHVATRGEFTRDESPALSLLLGQRHDFGNWVGCVPLEKPARRGVDWHQIDLVDAVSRERLVPFCASACSTSLFPAHILLSSIALTIVRWWDRRFDGVYPGDVDWR